MEWNRNGMEYGMEDNWNMEWHLEWNISHCVVLYCTVLVLLWSGIWNAMWNESLREERARVVPADVRAGEHAVDVDGAAPVDRAEVQQHPLLGLGL